MSQEIAIVAFAQTPSYALYEESEPSMIMRVVNEILAETKVNRYEIGFTIAGSSDYLSGSPFSFIANVDGYGAFPPVYESHVEMDGAWALWEAYVRLQCGDIDMALVVGSGKSSPGNPREIFPLQTDPYLQAPLGLDPDSIAGLQAGALIQSGKATERDFAEVVVRSRKAARNNRYAQQQAECSVDELLMAPCFTSPLRKHDISPHADGAAAVLIATGEKARQLCKNPIWIRGMDHRIDSHHLGFRDLTDSPSTRIAAKALKLDAASLDVAELCVSHSHEEIILRNALGLTGKTVVNPSGGPLAGDPVMATGLIRVIEAARYLRDNGAKSDNGVRRGLAHAASGPALQQNLLCILEGGV